MNKEFMKMNKDQKHATILIKSQLKWQKCAQNFEKLLPVVKQNACTCIVIVKNYQFGWLLMVQK